MARSKQAVRKFYSREYRWQDVKPGMLVHGVGGIVTVKSVRETPDGVLITPEQGFAWTQHPSNTVSVAFANLNH